MNIHGIQIEDYIKSKQDPSIEFLNVTLSDILEEILDGSSYHWDILFLDGILNPNQKVTIFEYEKKINQSKNGLSIDWKGLLELSDCFFQMYEITLLGSRDPSVLKRYESDQEMYEKCELVIELIDCSFWEVYAHDQDLILPFQKKFKQTKSLS